MNKLPYIYIIIAASLWGIIGLFINKLYQYGLEPLQIVTIRAICAAFMLVLYLFITNKTLLRIKLAHMKYFIGTGIVSFAFFNWCLFVAIKTTSLSVATILMYTAPAFVTIFSTILFKEKLNSTKLISLALTFIGCILVTGFLQGSQHRVSTIGILAGLGAGLGYALYSIFGKYALEKYDPMTIPAYTFIVAAIGLIPLTDFNKMMISFSNINVLFYALALGLFSTVLPFIFYTKGLSKLESSKASLIATLEPVVASIIGFLVFKEAITLSKIVGILLVITAIIIIREKAPAEVQQNNNEIAKENPM
ncbi:MAG: transporter [Clostridia bacterium]|jgi:drug/metabolite transporter (DMT)-like permease|nr:transporter [Clostridia bacterium]